MAVVASVRSRVCGESFSGRWCRIRYPRAGPLLTRRLNTELIAEMWDDLLRVAASVQGGHATAALVVGKLCSSKRQQNALTSRSFPLFMIDMV